MRFLGMASLIMIQTMEAEHFTVLQKKGWTAVEGQPTAPLTESWFCFLIYTTTGV